MPAFPQTSDDPVAQVERYFGKYPGIVIRNDPPAEGAHLGQIVVRVPAILEDTPDGEGQQPIEVIATPCFAPGFFFVPEVDQRVWVEFAAGDVNQPVWTGVWYARDGTPRSSGAAAPTLDQKILRSAGGHVIELVDSPDDPDAAQIRIQKETGDNEPDCVITIRSAGILIETKSSADRSVVLQVGEDARVTMDEQGVLMDGKQSTLKLADGEIELATGGTSIKLDGSNITLKGAQVAVE